ncbi:unnamed protein product [Schistosoma rodhaini]|uniref:Uncharacterized protein n=1 Tax=Schistosoma rodhaini TaxID=6188 RepID=A0AA85FUC2_9TREM|nr:unnamed protein product [Schistosoma rodhaini]
MNTNSCRDTTLHSDISPLLKHQSPRQELNEPCPKKKFKYQPRSSSSITCNDTFKLVQDYHKSKLESLKHNSTINRINNKMKCHCYRNDKMNYELDTVHNPIVFYSNLSTNHQKYTLWNNYRKRISTLGSSIRSKKKTSQHVTKSMNRLNTNNLINLKSKLLKNEFSNKNLPPKIINPIQFKTINTENFSHQAETNGDNDNNSQDCDNLHDKIFKAMNTIHSNYAFNHFKTCVTNQNNNFENKINDILQPLTPSNEINQIVHDSHLLKKNNYLTNLSLSSSSSSTATALSLPTISSSHLSVLPIKSLYDKEKLCSKQNNLFIQSNIRKHYHKLTDSIFNYNPLYLNTLYTINNDKPLDLRNPLQINLNTKLYKNYNNEIEKLNSNEIWLTIMKLLNRKLNHTTQMDQSKKFWILINLYV